MVVLPISRELKNASYTKSVKFCCMTYSHAEMIAAYYTFVKMIVSL